MRSVRSVVGAALFTIFVKGAGLCAPEWNRFAWKTELVVRKPAPLNSTRVRHPKFATPSGLNHPVNHEENLNDYMLRREILHGNRRACFAGTRGCERDAQGSDPIINCRRRLAIIAEIIDEILKLNRVGVAESLHKKWHGIVRDLILRHYK